ncbi:natural killer cells antigen CD94-like [Lithobates pipiens]
MEKADISGKKRWCLSCIRVILTLLLGLKITISCIFGVLVYKDQSLENGKNNQLNLTQSSADQLCDEKIRMMEIKKQLCVATSEDSDGCTLCPNGWIWHRENCYNISSGTEYRTWNESREVCEGVGADLLVIEDPEQRDFISRSSKGPSYQLFWIGLYGDGDGWRWVDGQHYNTSLFNLSGSSGDCVWLEAGSGYNKDDCQTKHNWICQKRALKI